MRINTKRFGEIEVLDEKKIIFENGLLGFDELKEYVLVHTDDKSSFYWIQSVSDPDLALACINPYIVCDDYSPVVDEKVFETLKINDNGDNVLILCVVVISKDVKSATVNLRAPIIINNDTNLGQQIVLQDERYDIRHPVFKNSKEG